MSTLWCPRSRQFSRANSEDAAFTSDKSSVIRHTTKATLSVCTYGWPVLVHIDKAIRRLFKYIRVRFKISPFILQYSQQTLGTYRSNRSYEHGIGVNFTTSVIIQCFTTISSAHKVSANIQPATKIFTELLWYLFSMKFMAWTLSLFSVGYNLERSFVWCWNSRKRSEILWKFWNVVLEEDENSWTYLVKNEDVLHRVKEEKNLMHNVKRRKPNWIYKFCVETASKYVIESRVEGTGKRRRRRK